MIFSYLYMYFNYHYTTKKRTRCLTYLFALSAASSSIYAMIRVKTFGVVRRRLRGCNSVALCNRLSGIPVPDDSLCNWSVQSCCKVECQSYVRLGCDLFLFVLVIF